MKHPAREEWIPFIFGEADCAQHQRLSQHLASCPECTREISGWRRSLRQLDRWPEPEARPRAVFSPVLKWAVAAALMLGLGMVLGRSTAASHATTAALRAEVEASVRGTLQAEMRATMQEWEAQHQQALSVAESRLSQISARETQQLWHHVAELLSNSRAEDLQKIQALLQDAEERHGAEFVALRKDLETLASTTDEEIRRAQLKLVQLAQNENH